METLHIYTRVSSDRQLEGDSIENQTKIGIEIAKHHGMMYELHDEGAASSKYDDLTNRPVLYSLIKQIREKKIKNLYVWVLDRLSRNEYLAGKIKWDLNHNKVKLFTKDGIYDFNSGTDKLMFSIISAVSEYDNQLRFTRFQAGKRKSVIAGKWIGGSLPYGYMREKTDDETGMGHIVINPEEAEIVKKIFEMSSKGNGAQKIQKWLNDNKVTARRGGQWRQGSIDKLLGCELYKGIRKYGNTVTDFPIIIDPEFFDEVVARRYRNKHYSPNKTKNFYLLKDLLICGRDGHNLVGLNALRYHVYSCLTARGGDYKNCHLKSVNMFKMDTLIWTAVCDTLINSKQLHKWLKHKFENSPKEIDSVQKTLTNLKRELKSKTDAEERLVEKYMEGKISSEIYDKLIVETNTVKKSLASRVKDNEDKLSILLAGDSQYKELLNRLNALDKIDKISDPQQQRNIILTLVDHIVVDYMEDRKKHVIQLIYKDPTFNTMLMVDGTDLKTGSNILQQRLERLEASNEVIICNDSITMNN